VRIAVPLHNALCCAQVFVEDGDCLQRTLTGIAQNVFNLQVRRL
jgi:hypothetical protein